MRIRWYSPPLGEFEWREMPETDEEALRLLHGSSNERACVEVYREWRELGASVAAALSRAGEAAMAADRGHPRSEKDA